MIWSSIIYCPNLYKFYLKPQGSRRIVRSVDDDDDELLDDENLEALRLAALRTMRSKVRKI